jgi:hypothetical protein
MPGTKINKRITQVQGENDVKVDVAVVDEAVLSLLKGAYETHSVH